MSGEEVDELIEFLEWTCDPCTDEEVRIRTKWIKKLESAQNYSHSNRLKLRGAVKDWMYELNVVRPVKEKLRSTESIPEASRQPSS